MIAATESSPHLPMITYEELLQKIISPEEALSRFGRGFRKSHRMVFTNGCFDLLHRGHVYYLTRAREMGDFLVVGLNNDESVRRLKGPGRPLNDARSRSEVLAALSVVDAVILFGEDTPLKLITALKPDILVKGGDYREEEIVGYREVLSWEGEVRTIPVLEGYSTTSILRRFD